MTEFLTDGTIQVQTPDEQPKFKTFGSHAIVVQGAPDKPTKLIKSIIFYEPILKKGKYS